MTDQAQPWRGKRAPTGLKTYPAWSTDPTRYHLDTALDEDRERPGICWPCVAVAVIALGGGCLWAAWLLR